MQETILRIIGEVLAEKGRPQSDLAASLNESMVTGLGLDSLDMATVVARLEMELDRDPFAEGQPSFETVADFVALYGPAGG